MRPAVRPHKWQKRRMSSIFSQPLLQDHVETRSSRSPAPASGLASIAEHCIAAPRMTSLGRALSTPPSSTVTLAFSAANVSAISGPASGLLVTASLPARSLPMQAVLGRESLWMCRRCDPSSWRLVGLRVSRRQTPEGGAVRRRRRGGVPFELRPQPARTAKTSAAGHLRNR